MDCHHHQSGLTDPLPGTKRNPYLISGDLITVQNSFIGRTSSTLKALTEPIIGIYATKEVVKTIKGDD